MIEGLDDLIESSSTPGEPFRIELGDGVDVELWYQLPSTFAAWSRWEKERDAWVESQRLAKAPDESVAHLWDRGDVESLKVIFTLHSLSKNREISVTDATKMLAAPVLVQAILNQIELHRQNATAKAWADRVAKSKKKS